MTDLDVQTGQNSKRAFVVRAGILFLALTLAFVGSTSIGWCLFGIDGVKAAAFAYGVCLSAAMLAELLHALTRQVLAGLLVTMGVRMAFPIGACLILVTTNSWLVDSGAVYQLVGFYFVTLIVESCLAVRQLQRQPVSKSA